MRLLGRRSSFNVQKVAWLMGELGLDFESIEVGGDHGGLDDPDFRAMNPHGKVPVLVDGDLTVWESHTCLRYLAAKYGGPRWWPESPGDRTQVDRWLDWTATRLQPDFMALFWGWYRQPAPSRDVAANERARAACAADYALLDDTLGGRDWLVGDEMTLADIPTGATLHRYLTMGLEVPRPPAVVAWYERLMTRTAYRDHVAIPFDELFGKADY